jgi:predicted TIM-barrel fold metal-dependent hydrolase
MVCYPAAKRAFNEWLDLVPSNRIMWGSDSKSAEEIYGAAELMRRCWTEVLAERVDQGDLSEAEAQHIGRQVLRENALEMFPQLRERLWKDKGDIEP